jgi:hypothetical protein
MEYTEVEKYYILNGHLKLGSYIKAEPIDINKNATIFYGFLTSINITNNLYSKTTITIKYDINGSAKFIKLYPIKYNIFFKECTKPDESKRKLFEVFLKELDKKN